MRTRARGPAYGALQIESCGAQLKEQSKHLRPVTDYDLAYELALRGYDVNLKVQSPEVVERRIRDRDAAKAEAKRKGRAES
jgi:hypothetical protein